MVFAQQGARPVSLDNLGNFAMNYRTRTALLVVLSIFISGCANEKVKPATVLCPLLGAVAGAGIVAGGLDADDEAAWIGGAALGAGLGHFLCKDKRKPVPPKPAPAPKPAPKPAPPPPKDTDGDGVYDDRDKCPGTPAGVAVDADGCPEVGETLITLEGVNFDFDRATIRADSRAILDNAVRVLNENSGVTVSVEGHTDSIGSERYNQGLSERRAQAVVNYLIDNGISAGRLTSRGHGESLPIAPNDNEANRFRNRRVELVVTGRE